MSGVKRLVILALLAFPAVAGCGNSPLSEASPSPATSVSPSSSPLACTASSVASSDWAAASSRTSTMPPIVSATVRGDALTLTFDKGTPAVDVRPQSTAHFTETNGRGGPVDLSGSAGVLILLHGFRGDMQNYTGPVDIKASGTRLLELRMIGDYEGTIGWAAGLNAPSCANVTASGSTLTIQFISQPS